MGFPFVWNRKIIRKLVRGRFTVYYSINADGICSATHLGSVHIIYWDWWHSDIFLRYLIWIVFFRRSWLRGYPRGSQSGIWGKAIQLIHYQLFPLRCKGSIEVVVCLFQLSVLKTNPIPWSNEFNNILQYNHHLMISFKTSEWHNPIPLK